jgi:hypothetical protein
MLRSDLCIVEYYGTVDRMAVLFIPQLLDFENAFDSVHRASLWKLLILYSLPLKKIDVIRVLHKGFHPQGSGLE